MHAVAKPILNALQSSIRNGNKKGFECILELSHWVVYVYGISEYFALILKRTKLLVYSYVIFKKEKCTLSEYV